MQVTLVLSSLLLAVVVNAYPAQSPESKAVILSQEKEVNFDGTFKNKSKSRSVLRLSPKTFQTENGIKQEEAGYLKSGVEAPISVVQGINSYTAPDGTIISTNYVSDENGYRAVGNHLPTPPPIPVEIQESLRLLASLPSTPEPQYQ